MRRFLYAYKQKNKNLYLLIASTGSILAASKAGIIPEMIPTKILTTTPITALENDRRISKSAIAAMTWNTL
jgi:hypothetical protein